MHHRMVNPQMRAVNCDRAPMARTITQWGSTRWIHSVTRATTLRTQGASRVTATNATGQVFRQLLSH